MIVSVVIPTYNEEKYIRNCLISLSKQTLKNVELIVVDDGSTDNTRRIIRQVGGQLEWEITILEQKHQGPAAARNLGALRARGKILVFVDADMTFEKDFLKKLTAPVKSKKTKGTNSHNEKVGNWDNVWARCWNYNENRGEEMQMRRAKADPIFRAILASEFERVGGFDKGGYTDDYSLSAKLGYEAKVVSAKFYHNNPDSLGEVFRQSRWVGKRGYKLGLLGVISALLRVSLPITKLVGVIKSAKYRTPAFFIFKLVYNTGVTFGIFEYYLFGKGAK